MDYRDIEQLLERYWQCETSVEEESVLRDFFSKEEVPAHLLRYKNLFVYQQVQQEVGLGEAVFGGVFYAAAAVCVSGDGKSGGCVFRRDRCRERMMF